MRDVYVQGVGMTRFGRLTDRTFKDLGREAAGAAMKDAGVAVGDIEALFFANSLAGLITGQESIRGQVVAFPLGFGTIPMHNVENACASAGDALHLAWMAVASGLHDTVLALGVEKAHVGDPERTFSAYASGSDVEDPYEVAEGAGVDRTPLVDRQAVLARRLMDERGLTVEAFAKIASRSLTNAARNPLAHRQFGAGVDDVLAARMVVDPITSLMSSPVSDGAAAAVISSRPVAGGVRIAASRVATRPPLTVPDGPSAPTSATRAAYEVAGMGPQDLDLAEVHDASVAYEVMAWGDCGLCPEGREREWALSDHTAIGGPFPINTSGGLVGRGHAIGASGIAQIVELVEQLQGRSGQRQVEGARVALAQIGGGVIGFQTSVSSAHILVRD